MEKIRKGNDIEVQWAIYVGKGINEAPYDLTGRNLTLYLKNSFGTTEIYDYEIEKHVIRFMFWGKEQKQTGVYSIVLVENEGRQGMHTVDECDAFNLVSHSCETGGDSEGRVECVHLQFRANMGVFVPTLGSNIEVDDALSLESENPVQNKVVTHALNAVSSSIEDMGKSLELLEDSVQSLSLKMDGVDVRMERVEAKTELALLKVESFDARMTKIENQTNTTLTAVEEAVAKVNAVEERMNQIEDDIEEIDERIDVLHGDAMTEGSVDNKISNALGWEEIDE